MQTDKPRISIVMAIYEPRLDWLAAQLDSLNAQSYPNLELLAHDDCSPRVPYAEIQALFAAHITAFPYKLCRNPQNRGSNGTFEALTREAGGAYLAYCDQDDIWLPDKLLRLQEAIEREHAEMVCSDMVIIDADGVQTADSMTQVRRHHVFRSGRGLAKELVFHNWVTGCTMLVRREAAGAAVPFCPHMVHDQYIALVCAARGMIYSLPQPLIQYRIHGNNQTGLMAGVSSRDAYLEVRVSSVRRRLLWLQAHFPSPDAALRDCLETGLLWVDARERYLSRRGGAALVWRYRRYGPKAAYFELFAPYLPERLFLWVIELARQNKL